ncbi:hypothetical protein [Ohessyouella blattaphilus]|uniref:C2H2-type domain-containing protein n=1 Tax=Ohessyouella blattaphilus TaxID=2949333 RepID=A0ABT1EG53_9FIRM|nr:hypothetical protein [Ohessyouella blattaphilus]MCP1109687.1 hypothetical protein [Ohessyouella blattaphilus]MCR8563081.1 hypothetical protein [Ohessyouella blattaphilus]MDL2274436.1 hypothetical protein [Oscillospiraceae bacterium OttesenSCG-928-G22]
MPPIITYRCGVCKREYPGHEEAVRCEESHLAAVSVVVKNHGIHEYPYSVAVTFSNGETREYVADHMR